MSGNCTAISCWQPSRNPNNVEIIRLNDRTVEIRHIDSFFAGLLRQIPDETDPEADEKSSERLFSKPMENPTDGFNEEWETYVEPDLRHLFQSSTETVTKDLESLKKEETGGEPEYSLEIPVSHLDQWLNTLNQARLVLATRNRFTDAELSAEFTPIVNSQRDMNLLQIHIYGFLQEIFLREIE